MIPYINDTRERYVKRCKEEHFFWAKRAHNVGAMQAMWVALWHWAIAEDLYGEHWDKITKEKKS
jgi:hypothetical protein